MTKGRVRQKRGSFTINGCLVCISANKGSAIFLALSLLCWSLNSWNPATEFHRTWWKESKLSLARFTFPYSYQCVGNLDQSEKQGWVFHPFLSSFNWTLQCEILTSTCRLTNQLDPMTLAYSHATYESTRSSQICRYEHLQKWCFKKSNYMNESEAV